MAIVMIQGPGDGQAQATPEALRSALSERAQAAGQALVHYRCSSEQQLVERLARIDRAQADIVLLEPGDAAGPRTALHSTLEHLRVPYIEVHRDRPDRPDPVLPEAGPRLALVSGYEAQGYTLAMSLALERLGFADSENEFNVGT